MQSVLEYRKRYDRVECKRKEWTGTGKAVDFPGGCDRIVSTATVENATKAAAARQKENRS